MFSTKQNKARKTFTNLFYAFSAQGISLVLSIIMSLIVPKALGLVEFSYWQLFLFYISFSGFFHLGLNDGLYLKYGGKDYKQLDHALIGSQLWISIVGQILFCICILIYSQCFVDDSSRRFVVLATSIYIILFNSINFYGCIFQATNRILNFSLSIIIDKVFFICFVISLLVFKVRHFEVFIIFFLVSKSLGLVYSVSVGREITFIKFYKLKAILTEVKENISIGINLMVSNIASGLVLGIGRFVIDKSWGITAFGKLSYAISLTGFFLIFIYQVSIVLFPALRQINSEKQKTFYILSRDLLGILLSSIFLFYLPINYALTLWLPRYAESLRYLILLLPLCTYDGKLEMLCSTYLKVLRRERLLLGINIITLLISLVLCSISAFVFKSIYGVVISMVVSVAIRSLIAERYIAKIMEVSTTKNLIVENLLVIIFVLTTWFLTPFTGFFIFAIFYVVYILIMKKEIKSVYDTSKLLLKR